MNNIILSNKSASDPIRIELIPATGSTFNTTDSASVISGDTLKMCLAAQANASTTYTLELTPTDEVILMYAYDPSNPNAFTDTANLEYTINGVTKTMSVGMPALETFGSFFGSDQDLDFLGEFLVGETDRTLLGIGSDQEFDPDTETGFNAVGVKIGNKVQETTLLTITNYYDSGFKFGINKNQNDSDDDMIIISQDPDTWELVIQATPNTTFEFYSAMLGEDIDSYDTDENGILRIDVNDEWSWWVPDASELTITDTSTGITNKFKIRVKTEGWIEEYKPISRKLFITLMPESIYEVYNARTGMLTNTGLVTEPYIDEWTPPVITIDIDKNKYQAGDHFRIVNKVMVNGKEHAIELDEDDHYKFLDFEDHQVTEFILDDWYKSTVWAGPELVIMTPYVNLAVEAEDGRNIYITNMEYPAEYDSRVELSLRVSPDLEPGDRVRAKMVIHKDWTAIQSTLIDAAFWFAGFPVIGSQLESLVIPDGIQVGRTFTQIEDLPTVIPKTLKTVDGWFNHHQGGTPEFWAIVKSWDMSHVRSFRYVFLNANVTGTTSIGWSMSGDTDRAFDLANISG